MTDKKSVRVSYGTAISLGFKRARQDASPTTAYLLWDAGCQGACSFCPRKQEQAGQDRLSRITWPEFPWADVVTRLKSGEGLRRVCLQTGWNETAAREVANRVQDLIPTQLPICVTLHPAQVSLIAPLLKQGVERVGIGIDAASPESYRKHKQRDWDEDVPGVLAAMREFPGRVGAHLIFGLGDSEETFLRTIDLVYENRGTVALFALTPVTGATVVGNPPEIRSWRRIQVFRFLRHHGRIQLSQCVFRNQVLEGFLVPVESLRDWLKTGEAFQTAGCPDCNRPYYNERPGGVMYNFPRPLKVEEISAALVETGWKWESKR